MMPSEMGRSSAFSRVQWAGLMALVLTLALAVRLHGIGFGLPALNDPDELMFELGAVRLLSGPTLNPGWFGHPATTTIYLLALIDAGVFGTGWMLGWFASPQAFADAIWINPAWVIAPGRVAMALFGTWSVWLTARLGRELFGPLAGLAAATLLALDPVHVALSQVIRSDMMATCFFTLVILAAVRIARGNAQRDYVWAAFWLGVALATKWPTGIAAVAVVAAVAWLACTRRAPLMLVARRLFLFGVMGLGFLLLVSPFLLLDFATVVRDLAGEAQSHHLGATGGGLAFNAWWYVSGPVPKALGPMGLGLLLVGLVRLRRDSIAAVIIVPVALAFLFTLCTQNLVWERWVVPLLPLTSVLAGGGFALCAAMLTSAVPRAVRHLALGGIAATALAFPLATIVAEERERAHDTRQLATAWAMVHVPPRSTILVEHFAFDMLRLPWRFLFPMGDAGCVDARRLLAGKVSYTRVAASRGSRSNVDYGTLAPDVRASCRADYAILTQYDRYAAERPAFPNEYAAYRQFIAHGTVVATIRPRPGEIGGPVVRIVRFGSRSGV